eukprot:CAMPEP_0197035978 /NCGR_PEP_ID=MMETSP1384-20130603/13616_1 /TAXON_ID=29189 /ORGANISM="Ammonia sp." /LENGTH=197 /DNA_ID=CAMNT_0042466097 /DNA_START=70 /DNA_END=663 /DNA_ORIENTATION=-
MSPSPMNSWWIVVLLNGLNIWATKACAESLVSSKGPLLALQTSTVVNAQTDSPIFARILSDSVWSEWKKIDNLECNDFESGNVDYFDAFAEIVTPWDAVALYNCGTDGWALNGIGYWALGRMLWVNSFCGNVGGMGKSCGISPIQGDFCSPLDDTIPRYEAYWLDQDGEQCPLVVVNTYGYLYGHALATSDPGTPTC